MRTSRSFQLPGLVAAALFAGSILLTGCSSNGMMIYKNTKHVDSSKAVPSTMSRGLFGLKNSPPKTKVDTHTQRPKKVTTLKTRNPKTRTFDPKQPTHKSYIIQKGDTLSQIAVDHKVGIDELASLNNMGKDDMIRAGQPLKLPYGAILSSRSGTVSSSPKSATVDYYTVQKGDFLGKIALKTKTSIADLRKWNSLKNDNIHIGWKLALGPGGTPKISQPTRSSLKASKEIPASGIHVVKSGDSISKIATMYKGMTSSKLKALNGLSSNMIIPGQELKLRGDTVGLPETPDVPTSPNGDTSTEPTTGQAVAGNVPELSLPHFVDRQNDTLKSVADMYGSKIEWIIAKNPGIKTDADLRGMKEINVPVME